MTGEGQHVDVSMEEAYRSRRDGDADVGHAAGAEGANGSKGIIPIDVPGIGVYECKRRARLRLPRSAGWCDVGRHAELDGGGRQAEDLTEEPYFDVCQSLNLRFLSSHRDGPGSCQEA